MNVSPTHSLCWRSVPAIARLSCRERELDAIRTGLRAATDHAEKRQREAKRLEFLLQEAREEYARYARHCFPVKAAGKHLSVA